MSNTEHPARLTSPDVDMRLAQLQLWVQEVLQRRDLKVTVASADASFRRYFRVQADAASWIVMDAPPEKESLDTFLKVAQMLKDAQVNAPRVLAQNIEAGFLLLTDLGDCTYLAALREHERADALYSDAIAALLKMQIGCATQVRELPPYDAPLLRRELQLFPEWFLSRRLAIELDDEVTAQLQNVFDVLVTAALEQPRVFVHRDYHSRNLMVLQSSAAGTNPGILDFQDAVFGPITYDLVSLLRDCYVDWPLHRVHEWLDSYRLEAVRAGVLIPQDRAEFVRWFDLMGVQRHLKAIGIFARLWHRDGKRGYLADIPRTLNYVLAVANAYPQLQPLRRLLESKVMPAMTAA